MDSISRDFGLRIIYEDAFHTIYTMAEENSMSRMITYRLYPGIELVLNDFKESYAWSGKWRQEEEFYQIYYSHNGIYQTELSKNKFSYGIPGNLMILNNCRESLGSKMTMNLQGFHVMIFPERLDKEIAKEWKKQFHLNIDSIILMIKEIEKIKVVPCGEGLLHVCKELFELLYNSEVGIVRLKLLEFFHLIIKEDFKFENCNRVFSKEQIEKTKAIKDMIETDLSKHYTIKELCDTYHISTTIFKECFKLIFQYPPYEYLRIARMNKAAEYLIDSNRSIIDIGKLLGYENPSNFTRTFKDIYGVLPKDYRNKNV